MAGSGSIYEDLTNLMGDDIVDSLEPGGDDPLAHAMGSALHVAGTLAELNTKVSDATLDTSTAQRTPLGTGMAALTAKATPLGADILAIADTAAANVSKKVTIDTLPIASSQVTSAMLDIASDGACAILDTTCAIRLQASASGAKSITTTSSYPGQVIPIFLLAASGGSYTLPLDSGTLTLDAASECAVIVRNAADTAWIVVGLTGATIV